MTTLTHQERAERAAKIINVPGTAGDIAREMFPRELVEAAREASYECAYCNNGELAPEWRGYRRYVADDGSCEHCKDLRAALSLYPEPEEETDHER